MAIVLPARTDLPHFDFEIELDAVTYGIELRWNARAAAWMLTVSDVNGVVLLAGRRVVVGFPFLARFVDPRLPKGRFVAVDTAGQDGEAGLADLGARVKLVYVAAGET